MKYCYCIIFLSVGFMVSSGLAADSLYIHQGIHGMKWGSAISDYDGLTKVHEKNQSTFYAKTNLLYYSANQPVFRVAYGFYRDRLYAAFIKLTSIHQFSHLAHKFTEVHGEPKVTYEDSDRQVVYRWRVQEVKIKMKLRQFGREYKLAFYYSPLADSLNREQLELISDQAYGPPPVEDADDTRSAPLLFDY